MYSLALKYDHCELYQIAFLHDVQSYAWMLQSTCVHSNLCLATESKPLMYVSSLYNQVKQTYWIQSEWLVLRYQKHRVKLNTHLHCHSPPKTRVWTIQCRSVLFARSMKAGDPSFGGHWVWSMFVMIIPHAQLNWYAPGGECWPRALPVYYLTTS